MPPKLNGKGTAITAGTIGTIAIVAIVTTFAPKACEEWRSFPNIEDKVALAQSTANAADETAHRCCDNAKENEAENRVQNARIEALLTSVERIDRNVRHLMRRQGVQPVAEPPGGGGAP